MSEAPLLLPREGATLAVGIAALVTGLLAGHATPTFSHAATVEKAELMVAKNVHELLPDSFRIAATVKKTGLTLLQSEDILLLGGDQSDAACSGGALFLYWEDGALGLGCQCNGPSAAGCPHAVAGCSDPAVTGPSKFQPNVEYAVVAEYSRKSEIATVTVDGEPYFSKHVHWVPPRNGPVTLLAGSHTSVDTEPFFGEARDIGVWTLPAGSWGWDMIGVAAGLIGAYVGLGAAIGRRTYQRRGSLLEVHPHAATWSSLSGMVTDGIGWTLRGGQGVARLRGGYSTLDSAGGHEKGRGNVRGYAESPRQREERDLQIGRAKLEGAAVASSRESIIGGDAPATAPQALPTQAAAARGVLSSGARETGAKVVY